MSDNAKTLVPRGKTYYAGGTPPTTQGKTANLLGQTARFVDTDSSSGTNSSQTLLTGLWSYAVFLKNTTGAAVTPGTPVIWKAGEVGQEFAVCAGDKAVLCGIVDDHLPSAGVADDDCCWVFYKGPINANGAAGIAAGEVLYVENGTPDHLEGLADADATDDVTAIAGIAMAAVTGAAAATYKVRTMLAIRNGL